MAEKWWFIDSGFCNPAYNMALDEMLLQWHSEGKIPPVVRFYGWKPAALSLGYFQKTKGKIDVNAVRRHGFGLVRRPTGGRAVLHDDELTYSVIVSERHPSMPASVTEAYRVISSGLLHGFRELGISASFSIPDEQLRQQLKSTHSAVCFDEPSWYELIVDGKKAAGSAQTRQKGVILQHGSIPLTINEDVLFDLFIYPNDRVRERARRSFNEKAVAINRILPSPVTLEEVKKAFYNGFAKGFGVELAPQKLDSEQIRAVNERAASRYEDDAWTFSR